MPSTVQGDYRLELDHLALRQEFFMRPSQVRLQVRAQLIDLRTLDIWGTKHFEALEATPTDDAYGGVLAANQAVINLLTQMARWLSHCRHDRSQCGS